MASPSKGRHLFSVEEDPQATQGPNASDGDEHGELPLDLVFETLKNDRRRRVLRYLDEHDDPTTLSDLAEHVAAIENDTTAAALGSQQRKRVYVALYQCHLPKLDEIGVIEFDRNRGQVERKAAASQLDRYRPDDETDERSRQQYSVGVVALSALALVVGVTTGVLQTANLAALAVGISIGMAVIVAARAVEGWR